MTQLLNEKAATGGLIAETAKKAGELKKQGVFPTLAIVGVGEEPGDLAYEEGVITQAFEAGVMARQFVYDQDISQEILLDEIKGLNEDPYIHGILVLSPLPEHIDQQAVYAALDGGKVVTGAADSPERNQIIIKRVVEAAEKGVGKQQGLKKF